MKSKVIKFFTFLLVSIYIYGPNIPSAGYAYAPKMPDEVKKLRK